jgi:hypothetical protein
MGQVVRHQPPSTAGAQHILHTSEHLPQRVLAGATARLLGRQQGLQELPRLVGQAGRVRQALAYQGCGSVPPPSRSRAEVTQRLVYAPLNSL